MARKLTMDLLRLPLFLDSHLEYSIWSSSYLGALVGVVLFSIDLES